MRASSGAMDLGLRTVWSNLPVCISREIPEVSTGKSVADVFVPGTATVERPVPRLGSLTQAAPGRTALAMYHVAFAFLASVSASGTGLALSYPRAERWQEIYRIQLGGMARLGKS